MCPSCSTEDMSNHHPKCIYHDDNFQTGEQQMIAGLSDRVKELAAAIRKIRKRCNGRLGPGRSGAVNEIATMCDTALGIHK